MQGARTRRARVRVPGFWWLVAAAAVMLLALGTTSAALATLPGNSLSQKVPIAVDTAKFQGSLELCEGTPDGAAVWHFVLTKTTAASATLEVTFSGGSPTQYPSVVKTGGTLHWYVSTASPATLIAASTDATGKRLNLSEICDGGPAVPPTVEPTMTFDLETGEPATPTFDLQTG